MPAGEPIILRLGHSPDPDDAFMWWPLFEIDGRPPRLATGRWRFEPVMQDIETLNRRSLEGDLEITALSCAQYPRVHETYAITACGASMGESYGPKLVAGRATTVKELAGSDPRIAVPGVRTTAFGVTSLLLGPGSFRYEEVSFDEIPARVAAGDFDAGVVIHEGQLTYQSSGLHLVADLGAWWHGRTGLPLPLGVNAIRRDLESRHGPGTLAGVTTLLRQSVEFALAHRDESIAYARQFGRGISAEVADEFISMYVNRWTLDFGDAGRAAVARLLEELAGSGLAPALADPEFIEAAAPA